MENNTPLGHLLVKPKMKPRIDSMVAGFEVREKWRAKFGLTG